MTSNVVYLLHCARPLSGHASHYIGTSTLAGLAARMEAHRHGQGARITAALNRAGIPYELVRTWPGGRPLERRLKRCKNAARFCPVCRSAALARHAALERAARPRRAGSRGAKPPAPPTVPLLCPASAEGYVHAAN